MKIKRVVYYAVTEDKEYSHLLILQLWLVCVNKQKFTWAVKGSISKKSEIDHIPLIYELKTDLCRILKPTLFALG